MDCIKELSYLNQISRYTDMIDKLQKENEKLKQEVEMLRDHSDLKTLEARHFHYMNAELRVENNELRKGLHIWQQKWSQLYLNLKECDTCILKD
ncbi:hypothetical protein CON65_12560 [Bacillus pseudomycoides]|uniref:Uncharacterized protein n=1 Tax=Bacillus pseudomycoides TaxID=64104 RepID=A0AA91VCC9_9BACI|nr:hypothetical protein [Bacillus pseudomycoides]PED82309.1 hypothetical protein CON65_12560 [Bacillus pseudomycoides]